MSQFVSSDELIDGMIAGGRAMKIDPLFLEQRTRRFGQIKVVQNILAGVEPGFKGELGLALVFPLLAAHPIKA
jgi:hypothetical protein